MTFSILYFHVFILSHENSDKLDYIFIYFIINVHFIWLQHITCVYYKNKSKQQDKQDKLEAHKKEMMKKGLLRALMGGQETMGGGGAGSSEGVTIDYVGTS